MVRILITGGTGFIGSRLALACRRRGWQVRVLGLTRNAWERRAAERLREAGVEVRIGALPGPSLLREACEGISWVFHLAAAQHEAELAEEVFWQVNFQGTVDLLRSVRSSTVRRLIFASTIGVYGEGNGTLPLQESCPPRPVDPYGRSKLEAERVLLVEGGRLGISVCRIGETYGPGDPRLLKLFRAASRGFFPLPGGGGNLHQPIYVDDVVEGLLAAALRESSEAGVFLLVGGEVLSTRQMVAAVGRCLQRSPWTPSLPLWPFQGAARLCEWSLPPLGFRPLLHRRRLQFFTKNLQFQNEETRRRLGFCPRVDFSRGVRHTASWYQREGYL